MRCRALKDRYLITICGPTGIGKTDWAIRLAMHYRTEILSADSRQFYREMQIGTAVPSEDELQQAPHHFIQHKSIFDAYSVGQFQRDATERLSQLFDSHRMVIMVGGSGLYLDAVTKGLDVFPEIPAGIRDQLNRLFEEKGIEALQQMLAERDPDHYKVVDLKNPHRLIRALEVCQVSGKPYSSFLGKRKKPTGFTHIPLGVTAPRKTVYERIERRVDLMMKSGLLREAESLYPHRRLPALQTVGYQELFDYLDGKWDLDTAVDEIKKNTRRFAKRQGTWFRRDPDIHWIRYDAPIETAIGYLDEQMKTTPNE